MEGTPLCQQQTPFPREGGADTADHPGTREAHDFSGLTVAALGQGRAAWASSRLHAILSAAGGQGGVAGAGDPGAAGGRSSAQDAGGGGAADSGGAGVAARGGGSSDRVAEGVSNDGVAGGSDGAAGAAGSDGRVMGGGGGSGAAAGGGGGSSAAGPNGGAGAAGVSGGWYVRVTLPLVSCPGCGAAGLVPGAGFSAHWQACPAHASVVISKARLKELRNPLALRCTQPHCGCTFRELNGCIAGHKKQCDSRRAVAGRLLAGAPRGAAEARAAGEGAQRALLRVRARTVPDSAWGFVAGEVASGGLDALTAPDYLQFVRGVRGQRQALWQDCLALVRQAWDQAVASTDTGRRECCWWLILAMPRMLQRRGLRGGKQGGRGRQSGPTDAHCRRFLQGDWQALWYEARACAAAAQRARES